MINNDNLCYEMLDDDIVLAQRAYSGWESSKYESPVDFVSRKRSADLVELLDEVIKKELTKIEQEIVELYYFKKLSISVIAQKLSLNRSTISRKLDCINEKIYCNLKYVVKFKYDDIDDCIIPLALRETLSTCAVKNSVPTSIAGRLLRLKTINNVDIQELSDCTKISKKRLSEIENGHSQLTIEEAVSLAAFFNVSTDYLLTGKSEKNMEEKI